MRSLKCYLIIIKSFKYNDRVYGMVNESTNYNLNSYSRGEN